MKKTIEIIVPCYNEAEVLPIFFQTVCNISEKIDKYEFSFLFIDDGSIDNTLEIIKPFLLNKKNTSTIYIIGKKFWKGSSNVGRV